MGDHGIFQGIKPVLQQMNVIVTKEIASIILISKTTIATMIVQDW